MLGPSLAVQLPAWPAAELTINLASPGARPGHLPLRSTGCTERGSGWLLFLPHRFVFINKGHL